MLLIIGSIFGLIFFAALFAMFQLNGRIEEAEKVSFKNYQSCEPMQYDICDILEIMELPEYSLA